MFFKRVNQRKYGGPIALTSYIRHILPSLPRDSLPPLPRIAAAQLLTQSSSFERICFSRQRVHQSSLPAPKSTSLLDAFITEKEKVNELFVGGCPYEVTGFNLRLDHEYLCEGPSFRSIDVHIHPSVRPSVHVHLVRHYHCRTCVLNLY